MTLEDHNYQTHNQQLLHRYTKIGAYSFIQGVLFECAFLNVQIEMYVSICYILYVFLSFFFYFFSLHACEVKSPTS